MLSYDHHIILVLTGERNIGALRVRCEYKDNGCDWTGKMGGAESHISQCIYCMIVCPNMCKGRDGKEIKILQKDLQTHLDKECQRRQFPCPHCKEKGEYQYITGSHKETCQYIKVNCSNKGCKKSVKRMDLNKHKLTCPHEKINCKFEPLGCKMVLCRHEMKKQQEMEKHEGNSEIHLTMALETAIIHDKKIKSQEEKIKAQNKEIVSQSEKIEALELKIEQVPSDKKIKFRMPSFNQHNAAESQFYSPPFYTHKGGYKMCIEVDANGYDEGKGSHISVYTNLMKGDYDDNLEWPIQGKMTFELLNQLQDSNHHIKFLDYPKGDNRKSMQRVPVEGDRAEFAYGLPTFIPHEDLEFNAAKNCQYLKDNCLYFRVSADIPSPNSKPWLH